MIPTRKLNLMIYCMPLWKSLVLVILFTMLCTWLMHQVWKERLRRILEIAGFLIALYWIYDATLGNREAGMNFYLSLQPFSSWIRYFRGVNEEGMRANLMNIYLFLPMGFFFAMLWRKKPYKAGLICILFLGFSISCYAESWQYLLRCGTVEVDDVIHNTLGALLGYYMYFKEIRWIWKRESR